ncbi:SCO6745 family protein [Pseudonocardia abyssalis]|jgi:hypothetical protein|uniref:MarR family transcriptional regulator n=1 Tax=Pseudonocardia abyssalis TaxID=2792008 RepID=A0ABS6UKK3_9PSEU|nr:hypothetical protein [Pseudonocardia abyssalis]MBW0132801.1 MarR family transcriptional regulator [Pseudonocardia abyssalis]
MDYAAALETFFDEPAGSPAAVAGPSPTPARTLRDALEPVAMHAVWSEAVNRALAERGHDFLTGYVTGRAAPLGEVPSSVVAATFAVFEPGLVDALWTAGRAIVPLPELIALRDAATAASLRAVLGDAAEPEAVRVAGILEDAVAGLDGTGRVLFAALRARPRLDDAFGRLWRAADLVREHRGDGHVAASVAAGLDPVRMGVLMEVWLGYPVGEYSGTRAWPEEAAAAAVARLEADGLIVDGSLTDRGRAVRDGIEAATDTSQDALVAALGDDLEPVVAALAGWSERCVAAGAFPPDPRKRAAG